jgi:hypothetical protein
LKLLLLLPLLLGVPRTGCLELDAGRANDDAGGGDGSLLRCCVCLPPLAPPLLLLLPASLCCLLVGCDVRGRALRWLLLLNEPLLPASL